MAGDDTIRVKRPTSAVPALFAVSCFTVIAAFQSLSVVGVGGSLAERALPMMGEAGVELLTVVVVVIAAYRMQRPLHRLVWALIGVGVLGASLGDAVWIRDLIVAGTDTMSLAGFSWYVLEYFAIPVACGLYAYSFRDEVDLAWPFIEAAAATAVCMSSVWFLVMRPVLQAYPHVIGIGSGMLHVLADYPLFVMPTLVVLLTVMRAGRSGLRSTWLLFGAGILFIVFADVLWFLERATASWRPGSLVDFAFMGGHVLIATAALSFAMGESWLMRNEAMLRPADEPDAA